ncbi:type IV secretory system conjugative DNA transfer family protein [Brevundimonas naejangsanensis]|uniref:type IV secretory system conjugative DNA transfer family protein n=1 Tax=Brevundimonas naejangsanensis TaxID=588932 RepID=UPI0026F1B39E|nr:type IV secretory system conjugative DNA transfer family protein [Brevundimonas naejangsanensis]
MKLLLLVFVAILGVFPAALAIQHGLDPSLWPTSMPAWSGVLREFDLLSIAAAYGSMITGRAAWLSSGGWNWPTLLALAPPLLLIGYLFAPRRPQPPRDASGLFGDARFASTGDIAGLSRGLELGRDPETGQVVRVAVQGTLATIAPPRKGKTSGLLIPNLAFPEPSSWGGPAVVIDPKGEVYRATAARRRALGRRVVCLDPLGLVGGEDAWNPLASRDANDVLYLQQTALALLPAATSDGEASAYFRNRAVDLIVGAMLVALRHDQRTVPAVQFLLSQEDKLIAQLKGLGRVPAALAALELLEADPKTKDPVKSTALQAFQWLADERLRTMVSTSSFDLADLSSGECDVFVVVPPEYKAILAPLLRWFLSDLFTSVRRNRPVQRIMIFIDEAAALGRFDEILTASGELPGYGASLWTMWQDRSQIVGLYGQAGADTILNTAEVVMLFDVPAVDPDEAERWSKAIGQYTARIESLSRPAEGAGSRSVSTSVQAAPLISAQALTSLRSNELIVIPNSGTMAKSPMKLHKIVAHADPRFARLIKPVPPVGVAS